jgi:molybdenum cofactor cytidylyltransferase
MVTDSTGVAESALIVGILLAAGSGRRFGGDKLMHPVAGGAPMALVAARRLQQACEHTVAVVRPGSEALQSVLASEGIEVVVCPQADAGMGNSLAAGVRASPDASGWLVALADMPFIAPTSYLCIANALRNGASIAAPACDGKRGHPVAFSAQWYEELIALEGDAGARSILASARHHIVMCPLKDKGILRDVDTREDLSD